MANGQQSLVNRLISLKNDPLRNFRYKVVIGGTTAVVGFSKISGLGSGSSETITYREGDDPISPRKIPGQNSFETVTFERGLALDNFLVEWRKTIADPEALAAKKSGFFNEGSGKVNVFNFRRNITISLIHRSGYPAKVWVLADAWPKSLSVSDLDANSSEVTIETLEVECEYIKTITSSSLVNAVQGTVQVAPIITQI